MPDTLTVDELVTQLRRLGVSDGDVVMVHASLRRIGPVEGGATGVIDAIDRAVGDAGTSIMTLGARDYWSWVNEHPEEARPGLLADAEPFDARHTPADPDVGVLAEAYRRHPGPTSATIPRGGSPPGDGSPRLSWRTSRGMTTTGLAPRWSGW